MKQMSEFVTMLEHFAELEVSIIRSTKINKVLKAILKIETIPRESDFSFKQRSQALLDKWNKLMAGDAPAAPAPSSTNGVNGASDKQHGDSSGANDAADAADADADKKDEADKGSGEKTNDANSDKKEESAKADAPEEPDKEKAADEVGSQTSPTTIHSS